MNDQKFMSAMGNIKDEYLLEALPQKRKKIDAIKNFSRVAVAVLVLVMITGLSLNAFMPVYARNLPFVGNVFAFIQDNLHVVGGYSNYAFEIGDKAEDNGLTITMSEAYCDGVNLYVSFVVESENVRRHIVGGANRTLFSVDLPPRWCRTGTCRRLQSE